MGSGNTENFPYRVRWSGFGDVTFWRVRSDSTAGFVDLIEEAGNAPILAMRPLREVLAVYKTNSIYTLVARGSGEFDPELKAGDKGIVSSNAVAPVIDGNQHLMVAEDNIYLFNGFSLTTPALGNKVRKYFFERLDASKKTQIVVHSVPSRNECWILFDVLEDFALDEHNTREAICWNWEYNSWTHHSLHAHGFLHSNTYFSAPTSVVGISNKSGASTTYHKGLALMRTDDTQDEDRAIVGEIDYPLMSEVDRAGVRNKHTILEAEADIAAIPNEDTELTTSVAIRGFNSVLEEPTESDFVANTSNDFPKHYYLTNHLYRQFIGLKLKFQTADKTEEFAEVRIKTSETERY